MLKKDSKIILKQKLQNYTPPKKTTTTTAKH